MTYQQGNDLHPLIRHMRNWQSFNAIVRKDLDYWFIKYATLTLGMMILLGIWA